MKQFGNQTLKQRGASLVEVVIYVGVLSVLAVFLIYSIVGLIQNYKWIQISSQVLNNATAALAAISEEIRSARAIYGSTSVLNQNQGQLSLRTFKGKPTGEDWTYVDFYLDNQKIYLKREGTEPFPLTSDRILVGQLKFTQIGTGTTTPSIRIDLAASPNLPAGNPFYFVKNFALTAGLR